MESNRKLTEETAGKKREAGRKETGNEQESNEKITGEGEFMFTVFIWIQYIGIFVLALEVFYIIWQKPSRLQINLLIVILATLVNFIGYLFEIQSTTKETALQAVKFLYLGKPYIILATFLFTMQYYKIRIPAVIKCIMCGIHTGVSLMVFTCERHFLFYSSIDYVYEGYFPHLVLGHSFIYMAYSLLILVYLLIIVGTGFWKYRQVKTAREKMQILYLIVIAMVAGTGFAVYFSGIMKGYDSTLPGYLICTILLLVAMVRYNLLDTVELAKETVIDEFADGLLVLDESRRIIYANQQIINIYPEIAEGNYRHVLDNLKEILETKEKLSIDDKVYEIHEKSIVHDDVVYGKMLIVSDITENWNYMIALEKQTVIATMANKAKTDFLAKMSHEIRTPINAVLGMNEMILRESGEPEIKKYSMDIKTSANALLGLINDILDTSKIESGKLEILPVEYELDSLLNDVVNMVFIKAKDKNLKFLVQVEETIPNGLLGDDVRIRQILVNLLNNAMKYTEKGSVSLVVSGTRTDEGEQLHFEIKDTGIGIKEEDMPKLYAAFERIEESRNRNVEGTGLGMNIVVELLGMMGAKLEVESVYGKGTVFYFDLIQPVVSETAIGDFEERSKYLYQETEYKAGFVAPDVKVLLVDDNEINRRVFKNLLKQTRVMITEAASGYECLERIKQEKYDIIFMDHMMPQMDGIETLHRMEHMEESLCKDVPVVILTANAVTGAKEKYLQEGFLDYLSKPIQAEKLEALIVQHVPRIKNASPADTGNGEESGTGQAEMQQTKTKQTEIQQAETHQPEEARRAENTLPEMDEIDIAYAKRYFGEEELLKMTMLDVYHSLDGTAIQLDELGTAVLSEETGEEPRRQALREYQTQVHALKSNTAMIGALILSKLARLLEVAAMEGNIERIGQLHPVLLEEMAKHKEHMNILESEAVAEEIEDISGAGKTEDMTEPMEMNDIEDEEGELWI